MDHKLSFVEKFIVIKARKSGTYWGNSTESNLDVSWQTNCKSNNVRLIKT